MHRSTAAVFTLLVLAASSSAIAVDGLDQAVDDWGRTAEDREIEAFLTEAEVINIEDVGQGITRPKRLTLRSGNVTHRAIFKDVDVYNNEIAYTNRFETSFQDSYELEVAAYRIDRLLGIRLVPVTVLREVNGNMGSVQLWIENATTLDELIASGAQCGDVDLLLERLMLMYVLDSVIFNIDRNFQNVLVVPSDDLFYLIDHSRSFRTIKKLPTLQEQRPIPIPSTVSTRLKNLDEDTLADRLGDLLTKRQKKAILSRRDRLVDQLDERGLIKPARSVITRSSAVE